jgi:hypothetical protein
MPDKHRSSQFEDEIRVVSARLNEQRSRTSQFVPLFDGDAK